MVERSVGKCWRARGGLEGEPAAREGAVAGLSESLVTGREGRVFVEGDFGPRSLSWEAGAAREWLPVAGRLRRELWELRAGGKGDMDPEEGRLLRSRWALNSDSNESSEKLSVSAIFCAWSGPIGKCSSFGWVGSNVCHK